MSKQPTWTDRNHAVALLWEEPKRDSDGHTSLSIHIVRIFDGQIRNPGWREPLDDLYIVGHFSAQYPDMAPSADLEYRPFAVDLYRARQMAKVLDGTDRYLHREYERAGNAPDYAAQVARLAAALKATAFVRCIEPRAGWSYDDSEHSITPMGEGIDWIRRTVSAPSPPCSNPPSQRPRIAEPARPGRPSAGSPGGRGTRPPGAPTYQLPKGTQNERTDDPQATGSPV